MNDSLRRDFLVRARDARVPVRLITVNGFQIWNCYIVAFDETVLLVEHNGEQQMFSMHTISTIVPSKAINVQYVSKG